LLPVGYCVGVAYIYALHAHKTILPVNEMGNIVLFNGKGRTNLDTSTAVDAKVRLHLHSIFWILGALVKYASIGTEEPVPKLFVKEEGQDHSSKKEYWKYGHLPACLHDKYKGQEENRQQSPAYIWPFEDFWYFPVFYSPSSFKGSDSLHDSVD